QYVLRDSQYAHRQAAQQSPLACEGFEMRGTFGTALEMRPPLRIEDAIANRQQFLGSKMHDYDPLHSPSTASRAIGDARLAGSLATFSSSSERKPASGPSASRSRACARASCDLEKLTVRPNMRAISACVYPSTS